MQIVSIKAKILSGLAEEPCHAATEYGVPKTTLEDNTPMNAVFFLVALLVKECIQKLSGNLLITGSTNRKLSGSLGTR